MGTQLQIFAKQMFKRLNQRQKKKLESKAKHYLDQVFKDQKKNAKSKTQGNSIQANSASLLSFDTSMNFESTADPQKYLDEVEGSLKKHNELAANFDRFTQKYFDDNTKEQTFANFIT